MSQDMASQLERAQQRYVPRLREASGLLTDQLARLREGDREVLAELRQTVHRLAGAAGSFGFPEVSAAALKADGEIKARLADAGDIALSRDLTMDLLTVVRRAHGD